jgi:cell division protein FtsL
MATNRNNLSPNQRKYRRQSLRVERTDASHPVLWRVSLLLLLSLVLGSYYVSLTQRRDNLEKSVRESRQKVAETAKEIENVKVQLESFKRGSYILTKAEELKLGLRQPFSGQVKRIKLADMGRPSYTEDGFVAEATPDEAAGGGRQAYP